MARSDGRPRTLRGWLTVGLVMITALRQISLIGRGALHQAVLILVVGLIAASGRSVGVGTMAAVLLTDTRGAWPPMTDMAIRWMVGAKPCQRQDSG